MPLYATTRYQYRVLVCTAASVYTWTFAPTWPIWTYAPATPFASGARSMLNPCSFEELSVHVRLIEVPAAGLASSPDGAPGVARMPLTSLEYGEGPTLL